MFNYTFVLPLFRFYNYISTIMLDILLGWTFFYLFFSHEFMEDVSTHFMKLTEVSFSVIELILY